MVQFNCKPPFVDFIRLSRSCLNRQQQKQVAVVAGCSAGAVASETRWREGLREKRDGVAEFLKGINLLYKNPSHQPTEKQGVTGELECC